MNPITLYKITCTKAFVASMELGTGYSLGPWGNNTPHYEGHDDGGNDYLLPDGYALAKTQYGEPMIYHGDTPCAIFTHSSGRPQLVGNPDGSMPVLYEALRLPDGITRESATYALDGPKEQRIARLEAIISALEGWETEEAERLRDEATDYLAELRA